MKNKNTNTRKSIIKKEEAKDIDYNSLKFKKGIKKIREQNEINQSMSTTDHEKASLSYNI
jgi:hypothetical protein